MLVVVHEITLRTALFFTDSGFILWALTFATYAVRILGALLITSTAVLFVRVCGGKEETMCEHWIG